MRRVNLYALSAMATIGFLFSGCATMGNWKDQIDKDLAAVSSGIEKAKTVAASAVAKAEAVKADVDARLDAAKADLAAKGAPVNGTPAELTEWAKQNPGTTLSSIGGFLLVLAASFAKYRTVKKGLTVAVDAVEALPPEAQAAFKAEAADHRDMSPSVAAMIASLK